jgi:adenylate kinase family enzyme
MTNNQIVIHISGSTGSGKTTVGNWITENYGNYFAVKDTDEFIQRGDEEAMRLSQFSEGSEEYLNALKSLKTRKIDEFIIKNIDKHIVFVGLMDHFGLRPFYDITRATYKIFIDIKPSDLIQQYYSRLTKFSETTWSSIWNDVAIGEDYIPSSRELIKDNGFLWCEHKQFNYQLMTHTDIKNFITQLVQ